MLWQSTPWMTAVDLTFVVLTGAALWIVLRFRSGLASSGALGGVWVVFGGLAAIALFFQIDLFIRWVLPRIRPGLDVLPILEVLHFRFSWMVVALGVLAMLGGSASIARRLRSSLAAVERSQTRVQHELEAREQADTRLARSEERLRTALEAAAVATWEWSADGGAVDWSHNASRVLGVDPRLLEADLSDELLAIHPDDRGTVERRLREALEQGAEVDLEFRLVPPDGEVIWVGSKGRSTVSAAGAPGVTGMLWNITERKRAETERESLERQLRHAQRMESLGTLAGGIAHDFNNILTPILGYAEFATLQLDESHPVQDSLEQVSLAAVRAKDLVQQILTFSRSVDQERRSVQVADVLNEALTLLRASLPRTIEIRERISNHADPVLADATELHQVVINLCTNAAHAMRDHGGVLEIGMEPVEVDEGWAGMRAGLKPGRYIRIAVSDTGTGMDPAIRDRVFDPFFTTKSKEEGTGLGLSMVHGIVTRHRGDISITSEPGVGTTVQVLLPVEAGLAEPEAPVEAPSRLGSGRLLFVDDEGAIAQLGKHLLERLGYEVTATTDGAGALETFTADPDAFDLVITDQTMPGMTGAELSTELLRIRPDLPIVLISGFSETMSPTLARHLGIREYVMKPFTGDQLGAAIQRALQMPAGSP